MLMNETPNRKTVSDKTEFEDSFCFLFPAPGCLALLQEKRENRMQSVIRLFIIVYFIILRILSLEFYFVTVTFLVMNLPKLLILKK